MNWRKPITLAAFLVTRPKALKYHRRIQSLEDQSRESVEEFQEQRLKSLLKHAYDTTPYYCGVLSEAGVVDDDGVQLENFSDLPLLTKDVLRNHNDELQSEEPNSGIYSNTSGGTTGEPVEFLQDNEHLYWCNANEFLYHKWAGREISEPWVKLWGDESEIFEDEGTFKDELADFVLNRHVLNSYRMGEPQMKEYIERLEDIQPRSMEAYVESINELAKYADANDRDVYSPNGILSTAGTLDEPIRQRVERIFDTLVLDKYGSREVGSVACECRDQDGLHVFDHTHYVEVVDEEGNPLPPGEEGELAITLLTNYTMPLIRYRIGDMGVMKEGTCECGRPFSVLEEIKGRITDHFVAQDGKLVYGALFRHLLFHKPWVTKFQVRQQTRNEVIYYIILGDEAPPEEELEEIKSKTKNALGEDVSVEFEFTDTIKSSESGKFRYTISDVSK